MSDQGAAAGRPGLPEGALTPGPPPTHGSVAGTRGDTDGQVRVAMAAAVDALHGLAERAASEALYEAADRISSSSSSSEGRRHQEVRRSLETRSHRSHRSTLISTSSR